MGDHDVRHGRDEAHRREILHRIVVELGVKALADGERRRDQDDRVAVGSGSGRGFGSDISTRPAAIFRHHGLAETRGHPFRDKTAEDVRTAAGREGQDEADRLARPGTARLGRCRPRHKGGPEHRPWQEAERPQELRARCHATLLRRSRYARPLPPLQPRRQAYLPRTVARAARSCARCGTPFPSLPG